MNALARQTLGVSLHTLSTDVRMLLRDVLSLQKGSMYASLQWLNAKNNVFRGHSPIELLRQGQCTEVQAVWAECKRRYGY
mgnify:FL=1